MKFFLILYNFIGKNLYFFFYLIVIFFFIQFDFSLKFSFFLLMSIKSIKNSSFAEIKLSSSFLQYIVLLTIWIISAFFFNAPIDFDEYKEWMENNKNDRK